MRNCIRSDAFCDCKVTSYLDILQIFLFKNMIFL